MQLWQFLVMCLPRLYSSFPALHIEQAEIRPAICSPERSPMISLAGTVGLSMQDLVFFGIRRVRSSYFMLSLHIHQLLQVDRENDNRSQWDIMQIAQDYQNSAAKRTSTLQFQLPSLPQMKMKPVAQVQIQIDKTSQRKKVQGQINQPAFPPKRLSACTSLIQL